MKVEQLKRLQWIECERLKNLTNTIMISEQDFDIAIQNICGDISRVTGITMDSVIQIVKKENKIFYSLKKKVYNKYGIIVRSSEEYDLLCRFFKVPDVSFLHDSKLECCLELYNSLTDKQKTEFLEKISM